MFTTAPWRSARRSHSRSPLTCWSDPRGSSPIASLQATFSSGRFRTRARCFMKPLTREWVKKAEGDFSTAQREIRARKSPNHDSACFHAQQCVEKYFKARLQEAGMGFPHTHDLEALLAIVLPIEPLWAGMSASAK